MFEKTLFDGNGGPLVFGVAAAISFVFGLYGIALWVVAAVLSAAFVYIGHNMIRVTTDEDFQ